MIVLYSESACYVSTMLSAFVCYFYCWHNPSTLVNRPRTLVNRPLTLVNC